MIKLSDAEKASIEALKSNDKAVLLNTLKEIREKGSVQLFSALFDLFNQTADTEIQVAILEIIMDVKEKKAPEVIVNQLKQYDFTSEKLSMLLSAIWQSGLDYGQYIDAFIPFVMNEELSVTMEALTCIEEFFYNDSVQNRGIIREHLKQYVLESTGHRQDMIMIYLNNLK
jgi:hypothetical protein